MNILMFMTGSIACAKATGLISLWTKNGHNVKVIASKSALEFVGIATIEGLSGNPVITSVFEKDKMMDHINLSREADIMVMIPATANSINKIANGVADDMISTTWLAATELRRPMYIAPAMNTKMLNNPITQKSIKQITDFGTQILLPNSGTLACGEIGKGRMMEIDEIDSIVMKKNSKKILITAGGTREFIDGVRYIGNLSTGKTGANIADFFTSHGYHVTWLGARSAIQPDFYCQKFFYETFDDLKNLLQDELKTHSYTTVIQAAAISDFSVSSVKLGDDMFSCSRESKIPTAEKMSIQLRKNPKLVSYLKKWSKNHDINVVAFKLTNTKNHDNRLKAITKLIKQNNIDFVAHNDLMEISDNTHSFDLYTSQSNKLKCINTTELSKSIMEKAT